MHNSAVRGTFNYMGGKFSIIPFLMPILDRDCKHFVDVFGGSGVVLLNRPQAAIETYNDINGKVVNFFKVLRQSPQELIRLLELTPHSRCEYDQAFFDKEDTAVEQARKFFVRTQQSLFAAGAQDKVKGWASSLTESRCTISEKTNKWIRSVPKLWYIAERLKHVQIECKDFRFILKNYDSPETLFYCDEPYDQKFRSSSTYEFDFKAQDYIDLHYWANKVVGKIAISGYKTEFMCELFKGFKLHEGPKRRGNSNKEAYECVWTNY